MDKGEEAVQRLRTNEALKEDLSLAKDEITRLTYIIKESTRLMEKSEHPFYSGIKMRTTYTLKQARFLFIVGLIVGLIVGILAGAAEIHSITYHLITDCEVDIPRSQHCELVAVPTKWIPKGDKK